MSDFTKDLTSLINVLDESDIKKLGYVSISIINEARQHQLWSPRMLLKNEQGDEVIIDGEEKIVEKLKEIYDKTRSL
jgi:hypothetical protein